MPVYAYRCPCGHREDAFRHIEQRDDAPLHCGKPMDRRIVPTMINTPFQAYRTVAVDKERGKRIEIRSSDEHRAFLRRNGYEEVGNDKSMAPPCADELREIAKRKPAKAENVDFDLNVDTMEASA